MGDSGETRQVRQEPSILRVEAAFRRVPERPDRSDQLLLGAPRREKRLVDSRLRFPQLGEATIRLAEEKDLISLDNDAAQGLPSRERLPPKWAANTPATACQRKISLAP